jgi:adenosylhomocysteine nucleosidase
MEAAAVARGAQARGVRFAAVKAISDESDFAMPPMHRFIHSDGEFDTARFVLFAVIRPWLWAALGRLERNSRRAARALCAYLERISQTSAQDADVSGERAAKWNVAK